MGDSLEAGQTLRARLVAGEAVVAGVLSGTSADGIDVALLRPSTSGPPKLLAFETIPFEASLGERVRGALDGGPFDLRSTALLHRDLGVAFGEAVRRVASEASLEVELVGSHGQTVYHHDGSEESGPATLQLGDGDQVAARAGAAVVSDFRQADVAAGGEGAPLSALVDDELYPDLPRPAGILNLGGIGNLTLLSGASEGQGRLASAFDTGPANTLLDGLARRFLDQPFDRDGEVAARGRFHRAFVDELLEHPFFELPPPRSTGRDTFGEEWIDQVCERARHHGLLEGSGPPLHLFATAVELVACSVAGALERFAKLDLKALVLAGGGARNPALVQALARALRVPLSASEEWGVDADAREALVFGLLAVRHVLKKPSSDPAATGAPGGIVLGKLSPAVPLAGDGSVR